MGASAFLPVAILAEAACWYAVLSRNHFGHAVEESLWPVLMAILSAAFGTAALAAQAPLRSMMPVGCLVYGAGAVLTLVVDVRMYIRRGPWCCSSLRPAVREPATSVTRRRWLDTPGDERVFPFCQSAR